MQKSTVHIRLAADEIAILDELQAGTFSRQQIAGMILTAALSAVKENDMKIGFPPMFTVGIHEAPRLALNETHGKVKK